MTVWGIRGGRHCGLTEVVTVVVTGVVTVSVREVPGEFGIQPWTRGLATRILTSMRPQ